MWFIQSLQVQCPLLWASFDIESLIFPLSGKPSIEIFCWVIFLHVRPFTTYPYELFQGGKSESHESWNCLLTFFSAATATFDFTLTALLARLASTVQHCQWMMILLAYLLLWHYHLFSLKSLIISTAGTFSHIYVCTRHINKINTVYILHLNWLQFHLTFKFKNDFQLGDH